jgi:hypothetical protein
MLRPGDGAHKDGKRYPGSKTINVDFQQNFTEIAGAAWICHNQKQNGKGQLHQPLNGLFYEKCINGNRFPFF